MTSPYDPGAWTDLFVATVGATAALTGLIFVGVSINLTRITAFKGLPERALEAIVLLLTAMTISIFGLVPQDGLILGIELLVLGLAGVAAVGMFQTVQWRSVDPKFRAHLLGRAALEQLAVLCFAAAGMTLVLHAGGGLYWVAPGLALSIVASVLNAWVLLVEILR